jgi:hypothetical protein
MALVADAACERMLSLRSDCARRPLDHALEAGGM